MKVTARDGHMPRTPGGRPWLSHSRQYSPRPMASCRMPAGRTAQHRGQHLLLLPAGVLEAAGKVFTEAQSARRHASPLLLVWKHSWRRLQLCDHHCMSYSQQHRAHWAALSGKQATRAGR